MLLRMLVLIIASAPAFCQTASFGSQDQIRSIRRQIDGAFQHHDAKRLATLFSSDCHFTAPSSHIDGSEVLERFDAALFMKRPDVTLSHAVNRIVVNENWGLASEQGEWTERWTDKDGITELRGSYMAMWKRDDRGQWLEYSEIIVPETCSGSSYCQKR